jgi:2-polyprenyl-3-methyl-5-hydroxy-6-metoxy-1,4-benzoquinol methylase
MTDGSSDPTRDAAFGQQDPLSPVDRFGVWLSGRRIRRHVASFKGLRIADVGCGYHATFAQSVLDDVDHAALLDVALDGDLKRHPHAEVIEGPLPDTLAQLEATRFDVVLCTSVLEHLWEPQQALDEMWRLLRPGGLCLVNVPSWRGKRFLEFAAFRLGLSPADEMNDHKAYYDPRDLWPMLVHAGFRPQDIRLSRHKFSLNTFAACRRSSELRTSPSSSGEHDGNLR